jgi:hypothetical protein
VGSVSSAGRYDGGLPRGHQRLVAPPGGRSTEEDWRGANEAKLEKLSRSSLQRRARARGLELRHSDYGYALIDGTHKRVDDRINMSLDEVESWLDQASKR